MTTAFKAWRLAQGLTQAEAAKVLGLSKSYVESLDKGISKTNGQPALPAKPVRKLMQAYSETKRSFEPFPLR